MVTFVIVQPSIRRKHQPIIGGTQTVNRPGIRSAQEMEIIVPTVPMNSGEVALLHYDYCFLTRSVFITHFKAFYRAMPGVVYEYCESVLMILWTEV